MKEPKKIKIQGLKTPKEFINDTRPHLKLPNHILLAIFVTSVEDLIENPTGPEDVPMEVRAQIIMAKARIIDSLRDEIALRN